MTKLIRILFSLSTEILISLKEVMIVKTPGVKLAHISSILTVDRFKIILILTAQIFFENIRCTLLHLQISLLWSSQDIYASLLDDLKKEHTCERSEIGMKVKISNIHVLSSLTHFLFLLGKNIIIRVL